MCAQVFFVIVKLGYEQLYNFFLYIYIYKKRLLTSVLHVSVRGNPCAFRVAHMRLPGGQTLSFARCLIRFGVDSLRRQLVWQKATSVAKGFFFFLFSFSSLEIHA